MALSSVQSLLGKIIEFTNFGGSSSQPPREASGVEELKKLSRLLRRIQAVQQDAEEKEIHDRSVRLWLTELRGVAYQAEDVLDEYHYEVLKAIVESGDASIETFHKGTKRKLQEMYASSSLALSTTTPKISIPDDMAEKIKSIRERFEEISNDHRDLHLREDDGTRLYPQSRPPTSSHVSVNSIYGRENEKEYIICLLNPSKGPNFLVLPIVGMGGMGKTTLAQLIYNDSKVRQLFDKWAWVSVSEDFDLVRLTRAIIESISKTACPFSELSTLQDILTEKIRGYSLLLVLDDVWNEERNLWECFRVAFYGAKTMRILTTTRNTHVAEIMQTVPHFKLGFLPQDKCWLLFKHFAFDNREESEHENLLKIGDDIVKKCKGSPLAIKVLGGMLRYSTDEEKWREVSESDLSETNESGEIFLVLRWSYRNLPLYLRSCFLYLSVFPKGQVLDKNLVIRLWMAQGYIHAKSNETLEEIGIQYFNELHCRSLVDYRSHTKDSDPILHDLVHDLARSISEGADTELEDDNLWDSFKVQHLYLAGQYELPTLLKPSNYYSVRTLWNYRSDDQMEDVHIFSKIACVRALDMNLSHSDLPDIISSLKHLRYLSIAGSVERLPESLCVLYSLQTLDVKCLNLQEVPGNIKNLVNLRYLQLSSFKIEKLPESVSLLRNLQSLYLDGCTYLKELPSNLDQLTNLCILKLPTLISDVNMPSGFGKLRNIRTLVGYFHVRGDEMVRGLGELRDMNKLSGILCISGLKNIDNVEFSKKANLTSKPDLRILTLNFENYHSTVALWNQLLHLDVISCINNSETKNNETIQESVLESLRPHANLTHLQILQFGGRRIPSWLLDSSLLPKLTDLKLEFCTKPTFLPPFGQLIHLGVLEISCGTGSGNKGELLGTYLVLASDTCKQPGQVNFPSLKVLTLRNMHNFIEWRAQDGDFPCLQELRIENCPKLHKIPTIPREVKWMWISSCCFQEIKFSSQSNINYISISHCRELVTIYCTYVSLDSLENISFEDCPKLCKFSTIPQNVKNLCAKDCGFQDIEISSNSKIENISISNCRELTTIYCTNRDLPVGAGISDPNSSTIGIFPGNQEELEGIPNEIQFSRLRYIANSVRIFHCPELFSAEISHCPKLVSLHFLEGDIPSLEQLLIESCPQFQAVLTIPNQLKILTVIECNVPKICLSPQSQLHELTISSCPELTSIEALHGQHFLANLNISHCPLLHFYLNGLFEDMPEAVTISNCANMDFGDGKNDLYYQNCTTPIVIKVSDDEAIHLGSSCVVNNTPLPDSYVSVVKVIPLPDSSFTLSFSKEDYLDMEALICAPLGAMRGPCIVLNLSLLVKLEISTCRKVVSVAGLDNLSNLNQLVISCCPELCDWKDMTLPVALQVLILHSCEKLTCLPFLSVHDNSKLILIWSCPQLAGEANIDSLLQVCRPHMRLIINCPLIQDWCQRNNISYDEFRIPTNSSQDDMEM